MQIRGANVLLTGAGGGLGRYIARALATEGANLALSDVGSVDDLVTEIRERGVRAESLPADLTDNTGIETLARHAAEAVGDIDILVNNAGLEFVGPYLSQTREQIEAITAVNFLAPMELTRAILPGMLSRERGHIVNIASLAGKISSPMFHTYNATKHGVVGLSHALRAELADSPVSVSVICPGFINRAGMYGRIEDRVKIPEALGTLPPERVGAAVVRAVREDVPEIIVTRRPVRPVIALASVFPGLVQRINRRLGADRAAREFAEAEGRL